VIFRHVTTTIPQVAGVREIVIDQADVPLPSLPAGEYTLLIGLYNAETGERLPVREETSLLLTTFTVQHHHTSGSR